MRIIFQIIFLISYFVFLGLSHYYYSEKHKNIKRWKIAFSLQSLSAFGTLVILFLNAFY